MDYKTEKQLPYGLRMEQNTNQTWSGYEKTDKKPHKYTLTRPFTLELHFIRVLKNNSQVKKEPGQNPFIPGACLSEIYLGKKH